MFYFRLLWLSSLNEPRLLVCCFRLPESPLNSLKHVYFDLFSLVDFELAIINSNWSPLLPLLLEMKLKSFQGPRKAQLLPLVLLHHLVVFRIN